MILLTDKLMYDEISPSCTRGGDPVGQFRLDEDDESFPHMRG